MLKSADENDGSFISDKDSQKECQLCCKHIKQDKIKVLYPRSFLLLVQLDSPYTLYSVYLLYYKLLLFYLLWIKLTSIFLKQILFPSKTVIKFLQGEIRIVIWVACLIIILPFRHKIFCLLIHSAFFRWILVVKSTAF